MPRWARHLGAAAQFQDLLLRPEHHLPIFASYIRDFNHVFKVSEDGARRNTFMPELSKEEVRSIGVAPQA